MTLSPQVLEDDGEVYTTIQPDDAELEIVEFGQIRFWENEVSTELSELTSTPNLED